MLSLGGMSVRKREVPYFPEVARLFFLAPHLLTPVFWAG